MTMAISMRLSRPSSPRADAGWLERNGHVVRRSTLSASQWATTERVTLRSGDAVVVKTACQGAPGGMLAAEAAGLRAIEATRTLRVPGVLHASDGAIVMEYLDLRPEVDDEKLGNALARMHCMPAGGRFGFAVDGAIGGTPQPNAWLDDWPTFFAQRRLLPMAARTRDAAIVRLAERAADRLPALFAGVTVVPSLLHGDLWSGNVGSVGGEPCVLDPTAYAGHAEADFGMSWCAGCFTPRFWAAYRAVRPSQPGEALRARLYEAYHILNHAVLFGSSYAPRARELLEAVAAA